jgi:hypothetical protein
MSPFLRCFEALKSSLLQKTLLNLIKVGSFPQLLKATIVEPHDSQKARLKFETLQTLSSIVAETCAAYPSKFGISHDMQQRGGSGNVSQDRKERMLGFRHYLGLIINGCGSRNKYINILLRFTSCLSIGRFRKEEIYSDTPNDENIHLTTVDRVCSIRQELAIWKQ